MTTALPKAHNIMYMLLGLTNEAGEAAGKLKKVLRGDQTLKAVTPLLKAELGDVAWYLAGACDVLGLRLGDVMAENLAKLADRKGRGVLQGNGDTR